MDDIQTILYIAIGVIYLVARVLKSRKRVPPPMDQESEVEEATGRQQPQRKRPLSFEELIKEISGETPVEQLAPEPESERSHKPLVSDSDAKETYEESIKAAKRLTRKKASTAKMELSRLFQAPVITERNYLAEDIAESLSNDWDIKKAIVINEILTRKYD